MVAIGAITINGLSQFRWSVQATVPVAIRPTQNKRAIINQPSGRRVSLDVDLVGGNSVVADGQSVPRFEFDKMVNLLALKPYACDPAYR